jgi:hypothetical protein
MTNLTAAAVLLGLREICAVSGLANSVACCLFMQRSCFNRNDTRHSGQSHNLHLYRVHLSRLPKADKLGVGKDKNVGDYSVPKFSTGLVKRFPHIL